jgi:hypothetical protein
VKRRRQILLLIPIVPIGVLFVLADDRGHAPLIDLPPQVILLGIGLIVLAIAFSFTNWQCPACRKYFGQSLSPNCCPKCGIALR